MATDNYFIAQQFSLLSKLMDIHGENSFKAKSYSSAAFSIDKLPVQLADIPQEQIFTLKGIGESTGKKIIDILEKGHLPALEEYILKTPPGILEMLSIKGLGPKKIAIVWKDMEIESPGELLYACIENRLARYKGFGEKSQQSIREAIEFYQRSQGSQLYASIEKYAEQLQQSFTKAFPKERFILTGAFRRHANTIDKLEWVTSLSVQQLRDFLAGQGYTEEVILTGSSSFRSPEKILTQFYSRADEVFFTTLFETTASESFLEEWNRSGTASSIFSSEEAIFESRGLPVIPPFLREKASIITTAKHTDFSKLIQPNDIKGIIHSHSNWSDGSHTIEQMAKACIEQGYEYLVISDHSKSAAYANGLSEERIKQQHLMIDMLNQQLSPFKIFKSIESDILGDGSLDYSDHLLSTFDMVIASVHSNLKMPEEKAMSRLLKAISNPYTTILGHPTGRLLLSRPGYPVDHHQIIDACAANNVVIEINAHPRRLDMDWSWISYAMEKGVLLSIDPDAHEVEEYQNCRYGVISAQKGGLTKEKNLSSFSLQELEAFLRKKHQ